jgi:hypothetical protein
MKKKLFAVIAIVPLLLLSACGTTPNNSSSQYPSWDSRSGDDWPNVSWAALVNDWVEACGFESESAACTELMYNQDLCMQLINYENGCGADVADLFLEGSRDSGQLICKKSDNTCVVTVSFVHNNFNRTYPYQSLKAELYGDNELVYAEKEASWNFQNMDDPFAVLKFRFREIQDIETLWLIKLIPSPSEDESIEFAGVNLCQEANTNTSIKYGNCLRLKGHYYKDGEFIPN